MNKYKINDEKMCEIFGFSKILDIATDILNNINLENINNDDSLVNNINNAVDDTMIYYETQWEIMKHYQNPKDANLDNAIESFIYDLSRCIENV